MPGASGPPHLCKQGAAVILAEGWSILGADRFANRCRCQCGSGVPLPLREMVDVAGPSSTAQADILSAPSGLHAGRRVSSSAAIILLLTLLQWATPLSVDLYLPALPTIARAFGSGEAGVQLTLSAFLIGFALGQLAWGPIGDRFGRRNPILIGLGLYLIATVGCALAPSIPALIGWRILQALGGCALPVLGSAMVRDLFQREEGARVRSLMALVGALAPLLAPLIGGQLMRFGSWRLLFGCLAAFAAVCLLLAFLLPETLPPERRKALRPVQMLAGYGELLTNRRYLGHVLPAGLTGAGMFAYISGTPFIYIEIFHVPPQAYGLLFGVNSLAMMGGAALNGVLVRRHGVERMLGAGCLVVFLAGLALAVTGVTGFAGLAGIAAPIFFYVGCIGANQANAAAGALEDFPHKAGAASAVMGCVSMGLGSLSGALTGLLADGTPRPMALIMAGVGVLVLLSYKLLLSPRRPTAARRAS